MHRTLIFASLIAALIALVIVSKWVASIKPSQASRTMEPLLITGEQQHFSILPAGTVIYFDRAWPEGHLTYHVYFDIKGELNTEPVDANMITPLWLRTVDPEELPKLLNAYPVTKDELTKILKANKAKKSDLVAILQNWQEE